MTRPIRLAILGCGAITRNEHIPSVIACPDVELVGIVDAELSRAQTIIRNRGLSCRAIADFRQIFGQVDAVINALPNHLHASTNQECLRAGLHVLCEKPLAITASDAKVCTDVAEQNGLVLAVGMNRRFAASHRLLKLVISEGLLGSIQSYDFQYGGAFDWRSATGFYFDRAKAGGGALMDFGVHMLDSVLDSFGPITAFDYQDDDWGSGIEANLLLDVKHSGFYGEFPGHLRISRTFPLRDSLLVRGTAATAEISARNTEVVVIHRMIGSTPISQTLELENFSRTTSYGRQLENFVSSIVNHGKPEVDGWQAVRTLELVESCYAHKRRIPEPWAELATARSGAGA